MTTTAVQTTQVYQVFIKATPEAIWDAITKPEFTQKYFYGVPVHVTPDAYDAADSVQGAVAVFDPGRRLVHSWRTMYDEEAAAEPTEWW